MKQNIIHCFLNFLFMSSIFYPIDVMAADECGVAPANGNIICNGDSIPASDVNPYANGISYFIDGLTLDVNGSATTIDTNSKVGVRLQGTGSNPIAVNLVNTLTINTAGGLNADGVRVRHIGTGSVTLNSAANILAAGADGEGLLGWIDNVTNSSNIDIQANGGNIETKGVNASGIFSFTTGTGFINIFSTADITTAGVFSDAILGWINNSASTESITLDIPAGILHTTGDNSAAISTFHAGNGIISMTSAAIITTNGDSSHGILASPFNAPHAQPVTINITGGTITTQAATSDGVLADTLGTGIVDINMNAGTITSARNGIHTLATAGSTVDVAATAAISATMAVIRDGDRDNSGTDTIGGNSIATTAGTLSGDIVMGLGNDTINLTGGSLTGNIYGDDTVASAIDGNDTFNWTDGALNSGFFAQNGSDLATISTPAAYNGSQILDGGDDRLTADGWIDTLTFQGINATITTGTILNWENIIIDGSELTIATALSTGTDAGTGLTLRNGGILNATSDLVLSGNLINNSVITMQNANPTGTLTIQGNYASNSGQLVMDAVLGDSSADSDFLIINGNSSGSTTLNITNTTGTGAATGNGDTDGILVVQVAGTSSATFTLGAPLVVDGFIYSLHKSTLNGNWYLQSRLKTSDIVLDKQLTSSGPYFPGSTVTYNITISNAGPDDATNLVVTDTMTNLSFVSLASGGCAPASFPCTIPALASGSNAVLTVTATINATGAFDNSATVIADQPDPETTNNTDNMGNNGATAIPPTAVNDAIPDYIAGTTQTIAVLLNDTTGSGGSLLASTVVIISTGVGSISNDGKMLTIPGEGIWTVAANGDITFTPTPGFRGTPTSIRYTVNDVSGVTSNEGSVLLTTQAPVSHPIPTFADWSQIMLTSLLTLGAYYLRIRRI